MIASAPKEYASEGCHAYDWDGNPHHSVPYSDKKRQGEMRPTTLRDIRKNGWLPSVSSILAIQAKPGLDRWKKEQVARAAWTLVDVPDVDSFVDLTLNAAEFNMNQARDLGSEIHGAIERFLKLKQEVVGLELNPVYPHSHCVEAAVDALKELGVWGQPFRAERSFASPLGYGGCIDLTDGETWITDFKAVDSLTKRLDYMDRCSQLTAYCAGLYKHWMSNWICADDMIKHFKLTNIFISTSEPGKYLIRKWSTEEKLRGWEIFRACQNLWELVNNYFPLSSSPPLNAGETLAP